MSFGHALYYPHINLTNKNWIKHALLFWDRISRIVPYSVQPSDNEEIIKIKSETAFISDYHPQQWDTSNTFSQFSRSIREIIESDSFFTEKFLRSWHRGRYSEFYDNRQNLFSELTRSSGTYIHVQKLDPRLKEYLFETGLAIPGENSYEDWVKIDNEIGLLYMTYFAKTISHNRGTPIVTDIEQSFSASINFESAVNSDYSHQFEYRLGNILIESVIPKNINNVHLDTILEIRSKYSDERTAFFNEVSNLSTTIPTIDNASSLEDALQNYSKLLIKETKQLEALFRTHRVETINKFLSISVPTSLASLTDYVPDKVKPFIAAGGVIFGVIASASAVKKEKLDLQKNPKSYLLNLQSELNPSNFFSRLNDSIAGVRKR